MLASYVSWQGCVYPAIHVFPPPTRKGPVKLLCLRCPELSGAARLVSHLWRTSLGRVRSLEGEPKLTSPQLDGLARKCITKWSTMDGTQARASPVVAWVTACDNGASMSYQDGGFMPRV